MIKINWRSTAAIMLLALLMAGCTSCGKYEKQNEPVQTDAAEPKSLETEPVTIEIESEILGTESEAVETEAEAIETEPEVVETEPEVVETEPEVVETEPEVVETEPEVIETEPEAIETEPEAIETEPEAIETEPEVIEAEAVQTEADQPETAQTEGVMVIPAENFLADIGASVNDRIALSGSYTEAELSMMTNDEIAEANNRCCESERWFMDRYKDARIDNLNLQYLCEQYLNGLQNQYDAYASWKEKQDIDAYNELWDAGYAKRAVTVAELKQYYNIAFADVSDMLEKAEELDALDDLKNGEISEETTRKVQNCLNTLQLPVGEVDGYCGERTIIMVKRFQKLYGYEPADGVIDDEVVAQLQEEADKAAPPQEETQSDESAE